MRGWREALLALAAWAVHFFGAYGLMLAFPHGALVGWATLGLGIACLAFVAAIARRAPRGGAAMAAGIVSAIAIAWQSLVAFF